MACVKEEKDKGKNPYTGELETIYTVYKYEGYDEVNFVASTHSREEAYGKYYERALKSEKADERRAKEDAERKAREEEEAKRKAEEESIQSTVLDDNSNSKENIPQTSSSENQATPEQVQQLTQNAQYPEQSGSDGSKKGIAGNMVKNKGRVYPVIRINDHFFTPEEIDEFYIETGYFKNYHEYKTIKIPRTGFVPTVKLVVTTSASDLLKNNQIKSGDKMAVFMSPGGGMVKSYRGDFLITSAIHSEKPTELTNLPVTYIIKGELFIPSLHSESEKTVIQGTSRDVMMEISKKLGLGFYFCDPDNTDDFQGWPCTTSLMDYALEVSSRAWKNFDSFFDCWIDPRYGLSFININKMLIADGLDEPIDLTPYVSTIVNSIGQDGDKIDESEETKRSKAKPQGKILTNIPKEDESTSPFYIKDWKVINKAGEIANEIGINSTQNMNIDNPGVQTQNTGFDMNYSIPINMTKLQNGFFVLMGPGVNLTYTQADQISSSMSFVKNSYSVHGGGINETMSNDDAKQMEQTGSNMMASGNTNKFYDVGWEHNMRNNLQLQKQYTDVECNGLNLAIMRGEKIPVIIMDHDKMQSTARASDNTGSPAQRMLYESASGWYIIDGLMWKWTKKDEHNNGTTNWTTKLKLVRREWPIPGRMAVQATYGSDEVPTTTVINTGQIDTTPPKPIINTPLDNEETVANVVPETEDNTSNSDSGNNSVPTTGLKKEIIKVYNAINYATDYNIQMVSARRWAVNEKGERVEGNAFVKKNGLYKCMNAKKEIMYFSTNNSRHLYGEAFDIINAPNYSFDNVLEDIYNDPNALECMLEAGVGIFIENTTDDLGVSSKHYHIGTDKEKVREFWDAMGPIFAEQYPELSLMIGNVQTTNTRTYSSEITHASVEEES